MILYRVYAIQNEAGKFYIGISESARQRLAKHNSGTSKWTKGKGPWKLVWTSQEMTLSEARRLENLLKRQKQGDGFYRLTDLSRESRS